MLDGAEDNGQSEAIDNGVFHLKVWLSDVIKMFYLQIRQWISLDISEWCMFAKVESLLQVLTPSFLISEVFSFVRVIS